MSNLLFALGALVLAGVAYWQGRRSNRRAIEASYRSGHRDGWSAREDKLQELRAVRMRHAEPMPGGTVHHLHSDGDSHVSRTPGKPGERP